MALSSDTNRRLEDAQAQIARLRQEVEGLMKDRVTPTVSNLAGQAQEAAATVQRTVRDRSDMVSNRVKDRPLIAIAIAAAIGWIVGRVMR
jgi:ElaB/YqjD/DUF883 family membrane-anchored ribosome-binding protein